MTTRDRRLNGKHSKIGSALNVLKPFPRLYFPSVLIVPAQPLANCLVRFSAYVDAQWSKRCRNAGKRWKARRWTYERHWKVSDANERIERWIATSYSAINKLLFQLFEYSCIQHTLYTIYIWTSTERSSDHAPVIKDNECGKGKEGKKADRWGEITLNTRNGIREHSRCRKI